MALAHGFIRSIWRKKEEPPIRAMYIPLGDDDHLMIGQNNGDVFSITMPDTILDENGKQITWQELKRGNLLDIYGDGIMLESYPGQYPGVTRIKVVSQGDPADADQYQDIIDEIWSPRDSSQLPCLNVGYTQSYGVISAVTMQGRIQLDLHRRRGREPDHNGRQFQGHNVVRPSDNEYRESHRHGTVF